MVQIEALITPECQEDVPSQGVQQKEEHRKLNSGLVHVDYESGSKAGITKILTRSGPGVTDGKFVFSSG